MWRVPRLVATILLLTCWCVPGAALAQKPPDVLARARTYVTAYSELFANLLSEERSRQELRDPTGVESVPATTRAMPGAPPIQEQFVTTGRVTRQNLLANYLVVRAETGLGWVPLRDVIEVNGRAVHDRPGRLADLLAGAGPADIARAQRIMDEGARHDLGELTRTLNIPVLGLLFLHPDRASNTAFTRVGDERVGGRRTLIHAFLETTQPTLVRGPADSDVVSSGRVWIDETTGAVMKTEHQVQAGVVHATVSVTYRDDKRLGLLLPDRMEEVYRWSNRPHVLTVTSRYTNYRRLDVSTTSGVAKPPPLR
jgi:hypothetical protein